MTMRKAAVATALAITFTLLGFSAGVAHAGESRTELVVRAAPGTPFADGDQLVDKAHGLVDSHRHGRLMATNHDPQMHHGGHYITARKRFLKRTHT